jgi:SAM-dependent methyltransferase
VRKFSDEVLPRLSTQSDLQVAIVGGSELDAEVAALRNFSSRIEFTTFGIEESTRFLDLNCITDYSGEDRFDLVLCSQVFEHIWNHLEAAKTLLRLAKPNGLIWVSAPASNRPHGSPEYFSAGFTAEFFDRVFTLCRGRTLALGVFGTKRNYAATHSLPYWLSVSGHRFPIFFGPTDRVWWKRIAFLVRFFPTNLRLSFLSPRIELEIPSATESWILIRA